MCPLYTAISKQIIRLATRSVNQPPSILIWASPRTNGVRHWLWRPDAVLPDVVQAGSYSARHTECSTQRHATRIHNVDFRLPGTVVSTPAICAAGRSRSRVRPQVCPDVYHTGARHTALVHLEVRRPPSSGAALRNEAPEGKGTEASYT